MTITDFLLNIATIMFILAVIVALLIVLKAMGNTQQGNEIVDDIKAMAKNLTDKSDVQISSQLTEIYQSMIEIAMAINGLYDDMLDCETNCNKCDDLLSMIVNNDGGYRCNNVRQYTTVANELLDNHLITRVSNSRMLSNSDYLKTVISILSEHRGMYHKMYEQYMTTASTIQPLLNMISTRVSTIETTKERKKLASIVNDMNAQIKPVEKQLKIRSKTPNVDEYIEV